MVHLTESLRESTLVVPKLPKNLAIWQYKKLLYLFYYFASILLYKTLNISGFILIFDTIK